VAYHVLAAPAYVLHATTRPLGWAARYVEQEFPDLFKPRRPPRGVLPLVELGGPTGFLAGLALYDNHLFGSSHAARIEGLYGGPDTFRGEASYTVPTPLGSGSNFETVVNVFSDPESEFYLDGNRSDRDADETRFSRDQVDVTAGLSAALPNRALRGKFDLLYEHVDISGADGTLGDRLTDAAPAGLGPVDLLTSRLTLGLDFTGEPPRVSRGTEVILQLDYTHDLTGDRFQYGRYVAEIRQYLPVGFFPDSRRLALRGRLEQVEPLFDGSAVPFYQLPELGGQSTLRGFRARRFQNDGSLLVNAEYRYPIWSNFDALVFVDAGQVFDALGDVGIDRFHWSYGGGIHLLNRKGLSFRFEVAGSTEGVRTILTVDPSFRRVAR
jgi:outer membrane protein assembly factor BamA